MQHEAVTSAPAPPWTLFTAPEDLIDADLVRAFLADEWVRTLLSEGTTLELKRQRDKLNLVRTVAAFANTRGGLLLVGIDEDNPNFDTSPGVPQAEATYVADQLRQTLDPPQPVEIRPVAIPGRDRVVLVIRVDRATDTPVLANTDLWVRGPGTTYAASRAQMLALVATAGPAAAPDTGQYVQSQLRPGHVDHSLSGGEATYLAEIRVAGAVSLRTNAGRAFLLGTDARNAIGAVVLAGALHEHLVHASSAHGPRPVWASPPVHSGRSRWAVTTTLEGWGGHEQHRLLLDVRHEGDRVMYAVALQQQLGTVIAEPNGTATRPPGLLNSHDAARALLNCLMTASTLIPDALAKVAGAAPARISPVCLWVSAHDREISTVWNTTRAGKAPQRVSQLVAIVPPVASREEAKASLLEVLQGFYLDLGVEQEKHWASEDIRLTGW